jgi:hypothetical protein
MTLYLSDIMETRWEYLEKVYGDMAEIGVCEGRTFIEILRYSSRMNKLLFGFDSFCGMNEPGERDFIAGKTIYPKGELNGGTTEQVAARIKQSGVSGRYTLKKGFIPACFSSVDPEQKFSFVYLDVDHYEPTKAALEWLKTRMSVGGLILCDDYFKGRKELASGAIDEFIAQNVNGSKEFTIKQAEGFKILFLKRK